MKKILTLITVSYFFLWTTSPVLAATASEAATATQAAKVASPAAANPISEDLVKQVTKLVEDKGNLRRTYQGTIKSVGTNSYVVTTLDGDHTISTGDVTSFYRVRAGKVSETNFAGIKKSDDVVAIGTIDPANSEMTAKEIIAKIARQNIVGTITDIDSDSVATISTGDKSVKVDISSATTLKKADATGKIVTAKLADFKVNATVFVIAYVSDADSDVLSSLKALLITK